jgi:predicted enzyme related to lactoylglutathione lyase
MQELKGTVLLSPHYLPLVAFLSPEINSSILISSLPDINYQIRTQYFTMPSTLGAVGIGVSNMQKSVQFYTSMLGMKPTQTFDVAAFTETVLAFPHKRAGSQIILMEYKDKARNVKEESGKLVFYVEDVAEIRRKMVQYGCEVVHELGTGEGWVKQIFMGKDPDGRVLEFMPLSLLKGSSSLGAKASGSKL